MSLPGRNNKKPKLFVSDLREFVYCSRSWAYKLRKVQPQLSQVEVAILEQRLEEGWEHHRQHGEAVCLASRQRRWAANWRYAGLVAAVLAIIILLLTG